MADGTLQARGGNYDPTSLEHDALVPEQVMALAGTRVVELQASYENSLVRTEGGRVYGGGKHHAGPDFLNDLCPGPRTFPVPVPELEGVAAIRIGFNTARAIWPDGTVSARGWDTAGSLGHSRTGGRRIAGPVWTSRSSSPGRVARDASASCEDGVLHLPAVAHPGPG